MVLLQSGKIFIVSGSEVVSYLASGCSTRIPLETRLTLSTSYFVGFSLSFKLLLSFFFPRTGEIYVMTGLNKDKDKDKKAGESRVKISSVFRIILIH